MKKMRILEKAGKQQLGKEISRHKFVKRELINAEAEIQHLKAVIEVSWLYNINNVYEASDIRISFLQAFALLISRVRELFTA